MEMKRAMYLVLAVLIILGAQIYSPPSGESAMAQREAPITGGAASIEVAGVVAGYLLAVKGIGNENEVVEHKIVDKTGGQMVQKIPGRYKLSDIVIRMNATSGNLDFYKWRNGFLQGKVPKAKEGFIVFYDSGLKEVARYRFFNAWPSQYKGITMDLQSPQMGFTEELVLTVEGIERVK
jgi:phage tail-like protein